MSHFSLKNTFGPSRRGQKGPSHCLVHTQARTHLKAGNLHLMHRKAPEISRSKPQHSTTSIQAPGQSYCRPASDGSTESSCNSRGSDLGRASGFSDGSAQIAQNESNMHNQRPSDLSGWGARVILILPQRIGSERPDRSRDRASLSEVCGLRTNGVSGLRSYVSHVFGVLFFFWGCSSSIF